MRIALLTDGLHPYVMGGMQRHSTMLAQHLPTHGVELVVFHTAHTEDTIAAARILEEFPAAVKAQVKHVFVTYPKRGRLPGHYIRESLSYSERLLESYQAQEIECDFIYAQGLTGRAFIEAKKQGVDLPPISVNCHGYEMFQRAASLRNKLEHLLLRRTFALLTQQADYVFSFSGKIRDIVEARLGVSAEKIIEVPNAIDTSWLRSNSSLISSRRRFIFLGRYERRKGIEELHAVLSDWQGPDIEFVFIGPIPEEHQLNLPWIEYRGSISGSNALQAELDQGDILVCPSHAEGMPTVILEAMARGLAIIATDVGATSVMVGIDNGILLDECSSEKIASAMIELIHVPDEKLLCLKEGSRIKVTQFNWDRVAKKTQDLISTILDGD